MLIVRDGALVVTLMGIAHGVEILLDTVEGGGGWKFDGYQFRASDIVHNGDLMLLIGFVAIQGYNLLRRMSKDEI
jgi:hypothetical protein